MAERGRTGQNYLLSGANATLLEMMQCVGEVAGRPAPRRTLPAAVFRLAARANLLRTALTGHEPELTPEGVEIVCARPTVVSTLAERELGYRPAPLRTAVEDAHAWLKAEGLLAA